MIRRLLPSVLVAAFGLLLVAAPAVAAEVTPDRVVVELGRARDLVAESVELHEAARSEDAFLAARNAYLDHFEYVEIPLRVRDEGLTLELEERFAVLRDRIRSGATQSDVAASAASVLDGLDDVERSLSSPGLAAPFLALGFAFIILFREGLEGVLVVATILGYLEASRNRAYRRPILQGVGAGILFSVGVFLILSLLIRLAPVQRELIEAVTLIAAVAVLFYVSFWLVSRLDQRRWMEFMRARVSTAVATGSGVALFGVGFTAVFREGLETTLFFQALLSFARGLEAWILAGTLAALVALSASAYAILRAGRRLPVKTFLTVAVILLMTMSVAFTGNAVRALQGSAVLSVTGIDGAPRFPIFLAELTGWFPTVETVVAQLCLTAVYVTGAVWVFVILPRRQRASLAADTAAREARARAEPQATAD